MGYDDLRMAIIKQALDDLEEGRIAHSFLHPNKIDELTDIKMRDKRYKYLKNTHKNLIQAIKFLQTDWADALAGKLDVKSLVDQTERNARRKIRWLKKKVSIYKFEKGEKVFVKKYKRLYDVQADYFSDDSPLTILTKIRTVNGYKYLGFQLKGEKYIGIFGGVVTNGRLSKKG